MATLIFVLKRLAAQRLLAVALIVVLGFTVGVLVAGPIYADAAREAILSSEAAMAAVTVKNARFRTDGTGDFDYAAADRAISDSLGGVPLERLVRQGRATVRLEGTGDRNVSLPLLFRDGAADHLPLVGESEFPDAPGEIALPRSMARLLRVKIGDTVTAVSAGGSSALRVTATFAPPDSDSDYWYGSLSPFPAGDSTASSPAVLTPEGFLALVEPLGLVPEYVWDAYLDVAGTLFVEAERLPEQIAGANSEILASPHLSSVTLTTGVGDLITAVRQRIANLRVPIYLVVFQIGGVALAVLAGVASLALSRQSFELAVLKSRGFTRAKLLGAQAAQTLVTAAIAYPIGLGIGLGLARLATRATGPSPPGARFPLSLSGLSLWAGLAGAVVGCLILILTSIPYVSRTVVEERRELSREAKPLLARYPWEIFVGALGGAAFYEVQSRGFLPTTRTGSIDPLVMLAPTLLLFAASFAVLRLLLLGFRWLDRTLGRARNLSAYLAGRRLGRSPGTAFATSLLLVLAAGLLVVSASYRAIVIQNHEDAAHQDVGADWQVDVAQTDQPLVAMGEIPEGATPVSRSLPTIPGTRAIPPTALGIDPATYEDGGWWRFDYSSLSLSDMLSRLDSPESGVALPEEAQSLEVRITAPLEAEGLLLLARVENADGELVTLDLGTLSPDSATYSAPVEGGGRLLSILVEEDEEGEAPPVLRLEVEAVEAVSSVRLALDLSGWSALRWRGSDGSVEPAGEGIAVTLDTGTGDTVGGIRPPEEPLPAAVSVGLTGLGDTFQLSMQGQVLEFRRVAVIEAFPSVLGEALVLPAPGLLERSARLPDATLGLNEVWAMGEDPRPALEQAGFLIGGSRGAAPLIRLLSQLPQSLAVGMHFTAAAGGVGLVVIGVGVGLYFSQRRREFEFASLRAMGVGPRQVSAVLGLEQAVLVGFALAAGFALGLAILRLMMPHVGKSLGASFPAPLLVVDWPWLGLFGAAILTATALGLVLALRALLRSSVTTVLRGEAE